LDLRRPVHRELYIRRRMSVAIVDADDQVPQGGS
jgi:hypothetical protein